jgi:hypothetical protein
LAVIEYHPQSFVAFGHTRERREWFGAEPIGANATINLHLTNYPVNIFHVGGHSPKKVPPLLLHPADAFLRSWTDHFHALNNLPEIFSRLLPPVGVY